MSITFDGISSGIATSSLVDQLIAVERNQQTMLRQKLTAVTKEGDAYRAITTKFNDLIAIAEKINKPAAGPSGFFAFTATSTAPSVSITTTSVATPGSITFDVTQLAAKHSVVSSDSWSAPSEATGYGSSIEVFNEDGTSRGFIAVGGTGTLAETVTAINSNTTMGLTAAAVKVGPNDYRLQVTSKESGEATRFSLGAAGDFNMTAQGKDAVLTVGAGTPGEYEVTSTTNTFEGLLPGATFKVTKQETGVTVAVANDPDAITAEAKKLVDAANAVLTEIDKYAKNGKDSTAVLAGSSDLRRIASQVLDAVSSAVVGGGSPAQAGIQLDRYGKIVFSETKFKEALTNDPALVNTLVAGERRKPGADNALGTNDDIPATGVAGRLLDLAERVTDRTTGTLVRLATGRDNLADDIEERIDDWDVRLELRRETLMKQFTAMEVALSTMKSQQSWLSGQLASLPSMSSS